MDRQDSIANHNFKYLRKQVALNQLLWSIGYAMTSGAFLTYFLYDQGAESKQISWILVLPELVATVSLFTRNLLRPGFQLKRCWFVFLCLSRLTALGIPVCCLCAHEFDSAQSMLAIIILLFGIAELWQAFSYVSYLSWLSQIAPEQKWGALFAWRNVMNLLVLLTLPVCLGGMRDWVREHWEPNQVTWFYSLAFVFGCLIQFGSSWPLRKLNESRFVPQTQRSLWSELKDRIWCETSLRWLLIHNWSLSFANGLTQAVFFSLMKNELQIGLRDYFLLAAGMNLIKIPVSLWAGKWCDRQHEKIVRVLSLLIASSGLWFFLWATPENWYWVWGVYFCWGAYAAANLSGFNLLLKVSPLEDNTTQIALFRRIGGLLAGISGLAGGYWLDQLMGADYRFSLFGQNLGSWHLLILVSLAGRYLSILCLWPVQNSREAEAVLKGHQP